MGFEWTFLMIFSCLSKSLDSASSSQQAEQNTSAPTSEPTDEPASEPDLPDDVDSDGFTEEAGDCDDWDPAVYPGAAEAWNGIDDDCNGWVDQDGHHVGAATFTSVGVYQGQAYSFFDNCSGTLERNSGIAQLEVLCNIDTTQERSLLLLGELVTISAEATVFGDESWSGTGMIVGSGGDMDWDTGIDISLVWSGLEDDGGMSVDIQASLDTFYLDGSLVGSLQRTE